MSKMKMKVHRREIIRNETKLIYIIVDNQVFKTMTDIYIDDRSHDDYFFF